MKRGITFLLAFMLSVGIVTPTTLIASENDVLLHVDFNEENAKDKSTYGVDGTIVGNIEFVEGIGGGKAARIVNADKGNGDNVAAIQYIDFGTPDNLKFLTNDFSISFWMKSDDYSGDGQALLSNKNYSSGSNVGLTYGMFSNSNRLNFTSLGSGRKDIYNIPAADSSKNGWKKVDLTVNRMDKAELYIDGVFYASLDARGGSIDTGLPFVIGASGIYKNGVVDATIDEIIVRKGLLSKELISSNYLKDEILYHKFQFSKRIQEYGGIDSVSSLVTQLQDKIDELDALTNVTNDISTRELISNIILELKEIENNIIDILSAIADKNQVLYMNFEGNVKDTSGNENHGTIVNKSSDGLIEFVQGAVGNGLHIKSNNGIGSKNATEYIDIKESENLKFYNNNFSVAMWVKFKTDFNGGLAGNSSAILGNKNWTSGSNPGFVLGAFGNGLLANLGTKESGRFETARNRDVYNNQWNFIVVNVDRSNSKKMSVYTNNILTSEKDISNAIGSIDVDGLHWVIGADAIHKEGMSEMYLDELRIFNTILDEQKINALYGELNPETSFSTEIEIAKNTIAEANKNGTHSEKRILEFEKGVAYLEEELNKVGVADITRLQRDLNNMYDRFAQKNDPLISFNTLTDTHIDRKQKEAINLDNYYQDIRFLNPDSKAIMNSGDFTDSGKESEYTAHYEILKKNKVSGREDITALGNHDVRWLCTPNNPESGTNPTTPTCPAGNPNANLFAERYLKYNTSFMESDDWDGKSLYYNKWIDGYNFVVINTESDLKDWAYLSEEQLTWLDNTLAKDSDPNKPIFIALHQTLKDTAYYEAGDIVGAQDEALKKVLRKYPQAVIFTGHIHSTVDRSDLYRGDWGHQYDMASFSYAYTSGKDRRNQIGYQINVFEEEIEIRVRDHASGKWLDEYTKTFSVTDPLPINPNDATRDLNKKYFEISAGSSQINEGVENLFDDNPNTIWHTEWSEKDYSKFFLDIELDEPTTIDGIRYMARSNAGNGSILSADVLISIDNGLSFTKHSTINFKQKSGWQLANFQNISATNIKIQVTNSIGTYASGAEIRITTPAPDISKLNELIEKVKDKDVSTYTSSSANTFKKAVADAKTALNALTQKEVNDAYSTLDDAVNGLVKKANTTSLDILIKTVAELDTTRYTNESLLALNDALEKAMAIDKNEANQTDVDQVCETLDYAIKNLVEILLNTTKLEELLIQAKAIDVSKYTDESVATLKRVITEAEACLLKRAPATQSEIDTMVTSLEAAINGLQLKTFIVMNKDKLIALVADAEKINRNMYTKESLLIFEEMLSMAKIQLESVATQEEIDVAYTNLKKAMQTLTIKEKTLSGVPSTAPKTGDETNSLLLITLLIAFGTFIFIIRIKAHKSKQ